MLRRKAVCTIGDREDGMLLPDMLSARFTYLGRERWIQQINDKRVLLDGVPAAVDSVLVKGMELEYVPEAVPEPEVCFNVSVIYQDADFLVLDKPANLPCHPAGRFFRNTLWAMLKEGRVPGAEKIDTVHFVNRLDRETSGIVLAAKNGAAHKMATARLAGPSSRKTYYAVVEGSFPETLEAEGWLYHDPASAVSKKRSFSFERPEYTAETAATSFRKVREQGGLSLVEAVLHTGRTHQIRATLCSLGFPLTGDKIYGPDERIFLRFLQKRMTGKDMALLRIKRQALHAASLKFGDYVFTSPFPEELAALVPPENSN